MEKIADLLTKFMISESSSENLDYEVCKFGLLMAIEVAINTVIALCISFLLGMFRYAIYEKQISLFQEQIYVKETAMLNDKMVRDKFYHQLSFIKELVYQRELSQLNEFIDGIMQNKKIEKDGPANSGNVLLDYIVNNKCEIAVKQGIECTVKIEVPYKFPFSDGDIFIILGNALDNAIEGALKCVSRRYIHIKIIYRKENLFIKISNSFDGKVKKDRHGHLISMKSDLTRYGLGLALIEKSVNKYNGLLNFDIDEENFTLTVLLYS